MRLVLLGLAVALAFAGVAAADDVGVSFGDGYLCVNGDCSALPELPSGAGLACSLDTNPLGAGCDL